MRRFGRELYRLLSTHVLFATLGVGAILLAHEWAHWVTRLVYLGEAHLVLPQSVAAIRDLEGGNSLGSGTARVVSGSAGPYVHTLIGAVAIWRLWKHRKRRSPERRAFLVGIASGYAGWSAVVLGYALVAYVLNRPGTNDLELVAAVLDGRFRVWIVVLYLPIAAISLWCGIMPLMRWAFAKAKPSQRYWLAILTSLAALMLLIAIQQVDAAICKDAADALTAERSPCPE